MSDLKSFKTIPEHIKKITEPTQNHQIPATEKSFFDKFQSPMEDKPFGDFDMSKAMASQNKSKRKIFYWIFGISFIIVLSLFVIVLRYLYTKETHDKPTDKNQEILKQNSTSDIILQKPTINSANTALHNLQNQINEVNHYLQATEYTQALKEAKKVTALLRKQFNNNTQNDLNILRLQHYNALSEIYYRLNKPQKGVIYSDKALGYALMMYKKESLETAKQYDLMAFHLDNTGNFDKALKFRYNAVQIRFKYVDTKFDAGKLVTDMNNLGEEYRTLGYFKQSQEILMQAIGIVEKKHGIDAPELIVILNNLGLTHQENNNRIIGLSFMQQAYLLAYKHYGNTHQLTRLISKNITRLRRIKP